MSLLFILLTQKNTINLLQSTKIRGEIMSIEIKTIKERAGEFKRVSQWGNLRKNMLTKSTNIRHMVPVYKMDYAFNIDSINGCRDVCIDPSVIKASRILNEMSAYFDYPVAVVTHVYTGVNYLRINLNKDKDYLLMIGGFEYNNKGVPPVIIIDKTPTNLNTLTHTTNTNNSITEIDDKFNNATLNVGPVEEDDKYDRFKINIGYAKDGKPIYKLYDSWNERNVTLDTPNHQQLFRIVSTDPIALYETALMYFKVHA